MDIEKSTRHQYIIGKFGEYLLVNWLSRSGFEVSLVDHTGLDVIAYNPKTNQRMGITVKSRTRNVGKEKTSVNLLSYRNNNNDREKLLDACTTFAAIPYIAVYVETAEYSDLYLVSLKHYDRFYRAREDRAVDTWSMSAKRLQQYKNDKEIKHIKAVFNRDGWTW